MKGTLTQDGSTTGATQQGIEQAAAGGAFFWLDLDVHDPGPDDDVTGLLCNTFHFHPVAVEAAERFGQRARIDDYDDFVHIVTFGMAADRNISCSIVFAWSATLAGGRGGCIPDQPAHWSAIRRRIRDSTR